MLIMFLLMLILLRMLMMLILMLMLMLMLIMLIKGLKMHKYLPQVEIATETEDVLSLHRYLILSTYYVAIIIVLLVAIGCHILSSVAIYCHVMTFIEIYRGAINCQCSAVSFLDGC